MFDRNHFARDAYNRLPIQDKLTSCKEAVASIRDTLKADQELESINSSYLKPITEELKEYLRLFDAVVNDPNPPFDEDELRFVEKTCQDASAVYLYLRDAIDWLRVAADTLKRLQKSFTTQHRFEYYQSLHACEEALRNVLYNI